MASLERFVGRMANSDSPDWRPLIGVVGMDLVDTFMWMYEVHGTDGRRLQAYKHIDTRRYLHLDQGGNAFAYVGGERYQPVAPGVALEEVLSPLWEFLDAAPEDVALARAALESANA